MAKTKRPTLQDIAEHIGITKMTISRYLRNPDCVAADTRLKIAAAIDHFGYIPNRAPDMLSNAKSQSIGVLLPSLTNQVFANVLKGIEEITDRAGYQTMLAHYGYNPKKEEKQIENLLSYNIDGLILSENEHTIKANKMLEIANIPVVEIMSTSTASSKQIIGFDNIAAAQAMTETMIHRGHKNIVYFAVRMDKRTLLKQQGYQQAMEKSQLNPRVISTKQHSSFTLGAELLHETLRRYPDTNGIFCTNDDLAIGTIFECQRLGITIPDQMAVAGFHGHDVGQAMTPQLATVITPRQQIGRLAAQEILNRIMEIPMQNAVIDLGYQINLGQSI